MATAAAVGETCTLLITDPSRMPQWVQLLEHGIFLLVLLRLVRSIFGLAKLGPRRAYKKVAGAVFGSLASAVPGFEGLVDKGLESELATIRTELLGDGDSDAWKAIPAKGLGKNEVLKKIRSAKGLAAGYNKGQKWGGIYHDDDSELTKLQNEVGEF